MFYKSGRFSSQTPPRPICGITNSSDKAVVDLREVAKKKPFEVNRCAAVRNNPKPAVGKDRVKGVKHKQC